MHFYIKQKELLCQGFVWSQSRATKVAVKFVPHDVCALVRSGADRSGGLEK